MAETTVGIVSVGTYSPPGYLTAVDIAEATGFLEWVVRDKLGIAGKHVAGPNDHANEMGIKAALDCLAQSDIDPQEIDLVLCTTEEWREYLLGLTETQAVYLGDIGHTGEQDTMFGIREGLSQGRLRDGDLMAIVAAGIGYVWATTMVQWGEVA